MLGQKLPYEVRVLVLFILVFISLALVTLVTFSSPFIPKLSFLNLRTRDGIARFGVFGWCDDVTTVKKGVYEWTAPQINDSLTGVLLLWPITMAFMFFATIAIIPLVLFREGVAGNKALFMVTMGGGTLCVLLAWTLSIFGWSIVRRTFVLADQKVVYGPANWMGLGAFMGMLAAWTIGWPLGPGQTAPAPRWRQQGPPVPPGDGYFHYKRTTRDYIPTTNPPTHTVSM